MLRGDQGYHAYHRDYDLYRGTSYYHFNFDNNCRPLSSCILALTDWHLGHDSHHFNDDLYRGAKHNLHDFYNHSNFSHHSDDHNLSYRVQYRHTSTINIYYLVNYFCEQSYPRD